MAERYKSGPYRPTRGRFAGREFASKRQYENALAQLKGHATRGQLVRASGKKIGPKSHERLRASERQARSRALGVTSRMARENVSLTKAARLEGTTVANVHKWAEPALERKPSGRYAPKPNRLYRRMVAITTEGSVEVSVRTSKQASLIGAHHAAVKKFLGPRGGDEAVLRLFRNKTVDGKQLETDAAKLEELWRIGDLDYGDIYD
jgi:hypothetical protein